MKWLNIDNHKKGYEISEQTHNGKTYEEIKTLLKKGEKIADYSLLQKLRNSGLERFQDFCVFVPNPDEISKEKGFVARFVAYSNWADLICSGSPVDLDSSLGVFIIRRKK